MTSKRTAGPGVAARRLGIAAIGPQAALDLDYRVEEGVALAGGAFAWARQRYFHDVYDAAGGRGHDDDSVAQPHGFADAVGYQERRRSKAFAHQREFGVEGFAGYLL